MGTATLSRTKHRSAGREYDYRDYSGGLQQSLERTNLLWLCTEMEKMSEDVIDREICRRLRQFAGQVEFDLPLEIVQQIRSKGGAVTVEMIPEPLLPFYRHFAFMLKRRRKARELEAARAASI
ncbi:MAG: hypothetical protein NXI24_20260 [bacterium]|nr:hypothetical protein [bacterium]